MKKPIILLTTGTRGDIQPYIALGLALQADGQMVQIATHPRFAALVAAYGLPFLAVEGNPSDLLARPDMQFALTYDGSPLQILKATLGYLRAAQTVYRRMLTSAWQVCRGAGALVIGLPTLWGAHMAEALDIPCIYAFIQPFHPTSAFSSALYPFNLPEWPGLNRLSYFLVEQAVWQPWQAVINRWRQAELGLPAAPWMGIYDRLSAQETTILYAYSPRVVPRPSDWSANSLVTGYWALDPPSSWRPQTGLEAFLAEGSARPLYIGFGSSSPSQQRVALEPILSALRLCGQRAVLNLPASVVPAGIDAATQFVLQDVHLAWLFSRCAAVIHHGGAGTTADGLRAGVPGLIVPMAADQFFWGRRVYALGAGLSPMRLRSLSVPVLVQAFDRLGHDPQMHARAQALSAQLLAENGAAQAAACIRSIYSSSRQTA